MYTRALWVFHEISVDLPSRPAGPQIRMEISVAVGEGTRSGACRLDVIFLMPKHPGGVIIADAALWGRRLDYGKNAPGANPKNGGSPFTMLDFSV